VTLVLTHPTNNSAHLLNYP